jgi:hypothetical protein
VTVPSSDAGGPTETFGPYHHLRLVEMHRAWAKYGSEHTDNPSGLPAAVCVSCGEVILRERQGRSVATESGEMMPDAGVLPPDLDRIEARAEAATPGPWFAKENDLIGGWCVMPVDDVPSNGVHEVADFAHREAAEFIAAARSDVPALVARVRALEAEVRMLKDREACVPCAAKCDHLLKGND